MRISEVLAGKAIPGVITINPEATVRDLLALLAEHNVGAVIVSTDGTEVGGMVSERDVVRRLNEDDAILDGPVSSIMTSVVHTCDTTHPIEELMQVMTEHRVRHVPVITDGKLAGMISIGDVVKARIANLEFERDQLGNYLYQT
ncbi:MAG: CBS domain-containing protein [Nocardioides sp.]